MNNFKKEPPTAQDICKDIYWHLINNIQHIPKAITSWENVYSNFKNKGNMFWNTIFKIPFITTTDTSM